MNPIRRAYIMAHLVNHGHIMRRDIQEAFGVSGRCATYDLTAFQELHGPLDRELGRSHCYCLPDGYDTTVPLECVSAVVTEIQRAAKELKSRAISSDG